MNSRAQQLEAFNRLLDIMDDLREKCPWDKKQTLESLRHLTIEETYELADAIRKAHAGRATLAPEAAQALIHATTHPHKLGYDLTPRERDTLHWMVQGLNNRQIAQKMIVSRSTFKFHVSNILSKLGVTSRTEAVALTVEHKIVN